MLLFWGLNFTGVVIDIKGCCYILRVFEINMFLIYGGVVILREFIQFYWGFEAFLFKMLLKSDILVLFLPCVVIFIDLKLKSRLTTPYFQVLLY